MNMEISSRGRVSPEPRTDISKSRMSRVESDRASNLTSKKTLKKSNTVLKKTLDIFGTDEESETES